MQLWFMLCMAAHCDRYSTAFNFAHSQVMESETGRQLLREAEPYDDKKVRCYKNSKGKKVCVATCYKKHCHKCASSASYLRLLPFDGALLSACAALSHHGTALP